MKRIFYSVAILAATMIGFTSCEEEESVCDKFVGDYSAELTYMVSEDGTNFLNIDNNTLATYGLTIKIDPITISKEDDDALAIEIGSDKFKTSTIKDENGVNFYFNLDGTCTFEGGNFTGKQTYQGYHGNIISAVGTMIEFSIVGKTSDFPKMKDINTYNYVKIDFSLDKK